VPSYLPTRRRGALACLAASIALAPALAPAAAVAEAPAVVQYSLRQEEPSVGGGGAGTVAGDYTGGEQGTDGRSTSLALVFGLMGTATAITVAGAALALRQGRRAASNLALRTEDWMTLVRRLSFPIVGVLALVATTLVISGSYIVDTAESRGSRVPRVFWGMAPQDVPTQAEFNRMKRGGVDSVRYHLVWAEIQPSQGTTNWDSFDVIVRRAAKARLEILPFVWGTPPWVDPNSLALPVKSAQQRAAWQNFLRLVVRRYGRRGSFWSQNRGIPKLPVRIVQIWNEANFFYFTDPISPSQYGRLVKISRAALRSVDRRIQIVLGGLFASPRQGPPQAMEGRRFLAQLYRVRGIKAAFDGVALHPYANNFRELRSQIRGFRAVMARNRDSRTGFWITEMGWGSGRGTAFEKGIRGQVRQLSGSFSLLRNKRQQWKVKRVYWFSWKDRSGSCNFCDSIGLIRENNSAKPAWFRYIRFAGGRR
jgi:hypothetical protein